MTGLAALGVLGIAIIIGIWAFISSAFHEETDIEKHHRKLFIPSILLIPFIINAISFLPFSNASIVGLSLMINYTFYAFGLAFILYFSLSSYGLILFAKAVLVSLPFALALVFPTWDFYEQLYSISIYD